MTMKKKSRKREKESKWLLDKGANNDIQKKEQHQHSANE